MVKELFNKYNDGFIHNASKYELEDAANEIYDIMWRKYGYGTPEFDDLLRLHQKIVDQKSELCKNRDPNYRWTDANRWDKD